MADNVEKAAKAVKLFGFEIKRSKKEDEAVTPLSQASVVAPTDDDGAGYVTSPAYHYGMHLDIYADLQVKDHADLIRKYRVMATHPEVDMAIEEIVNEAIVHPQYNENKVVDLDLDSVGVSESVKKKVHEEFAYILKLLSFNERAHDMFRQWYIDGRTYHHLVVDKNNLKAGLREIRNIDALKIRKVKHVKKKEENGITLVDKVDEFYIYSEKSASACAPQGGTGWTSNNANTQAVRLSNDSVSYVTSGLLDEMKSKVISHLHKAMRPINQLRMMEDSLIIYRLARAPERRIFYVDVGNLPKGKAEAYINTLMTRYRNKLVYDANTGEIRDDKKYMAMLEDFWLPRREGGRGTEISTLPGGQNLGEITDIEYFKKKLYRSLNVPPSRMDGEGGFNLGRSSEILRDELKFTKFVSRLRKRFSNMFNDMLKTQLILKNVITPEDWEVMSEHIQYDFLYDNHFSELKESELLNERLGSLQQAEPYIGKYFSQDYVRRKILRQTDQEIIEQDKLIKKEIKDGTIPDPALMQIDPSTGEPTDLGQPIMEPDLEAQAQSTEAPELPKGGEI